MRTDVVIIGAGQAGLAMSRCLTGRGIAHVVLERGRIAERWRSSTWDSLRLLTPNWMTRLPSWSYRGADPDGFMRRDELVGHLEAYAAAFRAPVAPETRVRAVEHRHGRYQVTTDRGTWQAPAVVIATGDCDVPHVPALARLSPRIHQLTPASYKRAADLPQGGVLVVGAASSGVQLAEEIHASGRPVWLAAGRHTRLPRRYGGQDIMWWLDRIGVLSERAEAMRDLEAARRQPSLQLVGHPQHRSLDLMTLKAAGIRIVGRLVAADAMRVHFADDLAASVAESERRRARLLARIDCVMRLNGTATPPDPSPMRLAVDAVPTSLDLDRAGIRTVLWATGYRRSTAWLKLPVRDRHGEIMHQGGVTPAPGLYVLGLRILRRRNSNFIDGVGRDAQELAAHIAEQLHARRHLAA
jgi:putative flavoprotein involved in K+ transport